MPPMICTATSTSPSQTHAITDAATGSKVATMPTVVAWAWLGQELVAVQIVGGAVVLVGILLAETAR